MKSVAGSTDRDIESQRLVFDVAKQLVTLSVAAIGVITSLLFTTFKGTPFVTSAEVSLSSFLLCAVFSVLVQVAIISKTRREQSRISINYPVAMLFVAWAALVTGLAAFVIFTWANINANAR